MTYTRIIAWTAMSVFLLAASVSAMNMPDTGQNKCYDNTQEIACPQPGEPFFGQDAQYHGRARAYVKLGKNGVELSPFAAHVDDGGPWIMTKDSVTGLIWETKTEDNKNETFNWAHLWMPVGNMSIARFGGYDDWRVPTILELSSLINGGRHDPALDQVWFRNMQPVSYWSSNAQAGDARKAWEAHFFYGNVNPGNKDPGVLFPVRFVAVRGNQTAPLALVDNGDGTITDPNTKLMWQRCGDWLVWNGSACEGNTFLSRNWNDALAYAEGLSLAGYGDWRLPNRNELQTLVNYALHDPAVDALFAANPREPHWTSTTWPGDMVTAMSVNLRTGDVNRRYKHEPQFVLAVRRGQEWHQGSLRVIIEPAAAREADARWRRAGTIPWRKSGDTDLHMPASFISGTQSIEFRAIPGWVKPANKNVQVYGATTTVTVQYTPAMIPPGVLMLLLDE